MEGLSRETLLGILGWLGVVLVLAALALKVLRPELNIHPKLALAGLVVTGSMRSASGATSADRSRAATSSTDRSRSAAC